MLNKICLRPANSRRLLAVLTLGCWVVILLVYFFLIKQPTKSTHVRDNIGETVINWEHAPPLAMILLNNGNTQLLLTTAFRDPRLHGIVRVLAAGRVKPLPKLYCRMEGNDNIVFPTVPATAVTPLLRNEKVHYDGLFIDCPLPPSTRTPPHYVAVTTNASESGLRNFLRITTVPDIPPRSTSMAACVCPLHGSGSWVSPRHLVSWIEMNRLLGVERFFFYNYSAPASLQSLFHYYSRIGVVELLQWQPAPIPTAELGSWPPKEKELHYFGQFFVFNECLYRVLHHHRFAMFADLDELLVPSKPRQRLADFVSSLDTNRTLAFAFRGSYLRTDFEQERDHRDVLFLRYARREKRVLTWQQAPKLVVKPHLVLKMGIHDIVEQASVPEGKQRPELRVVAPAEGLLMHYKSPPRYLRQEDAGTRDERVLLFRRQLVYNVRRTLGQL